MEKPRTKLGKVILISCINLSEGQKPRIVEYNYDTMKEFGYIDKDGRLTE